MFGTVVWNQLGHLSLRQPKRFVFKSALDLRAPVLGLVENDGGLGRRFLTHGEAFC